jgi:hypothetical protein
VIVNHHTILLLDLYAKNDQEDPSTQELKALVTLRNLMVGEIRSGDITLVLRQSDNAWVQTTGYRPPDSAATSHKTGSP